MFHNDGTGGGAVVLLSGGLDSTVACAMALTEYDLRYAVFFDYGQNPLEEERRAVESIVGHFRIGLIEVPLRWMGEFSSSTLVSRGRARGTPGLPDAWIENRNGIFINVAALVAAGRDCGTIVVGFNREEAVDFPDNRAEYLEAVNNALENGVGRPVKVISPTIEMDKREIVAVGEKLGVPFEYIWSCYSSGALMCGECESCVRLKRAVKGTPVEKRVRFAR